MRDGVSAPDQDLKPGADAAAALSRAPHGMITVLSSGEYEDYRVHCVFVDPADAERAAGELNAGRYLDFDTETIPLMS